MSSQFISKQSLLRQKRGADFNKATSSALGTVRVDGVTVLIDSSGTISVVPGVTPDSTSIVINSGIISVSSVLSNTRILPRTSSQTGSAGGTFAINTDLYDTFLLTALGNSVTFSAPAGTPVNGQKLIIRIKDNGSSRVITFTGAGSNAFRGIGLTLPTTTVLNKVLYVGCIYNADDAYWDVIATAQQA